MSVVEVGNRKQPYSGWSYFVEHPSFEPLRNFNQHFIRCFSSLPENGILMKLMEVIKRVCIVCVAPFAYLALVIVGVAGALISKKVVCAEGNDCVLSVNRSVKEKNSSLLDELIGCCNQEASECTKELLETNPVSKVKLVVKCSYLFKKRCYELDLFSEERVTSEKFEKSLFSLHHNIKDRIKESSPVDIHGTEVIGDAFFLAGQDVHHSQWKIELPAMETWNANCSLSEEESSFHVSSSCNLLASSEESIIDHLAMCYLKVGAELPERDQLLCSLFETRILRDANHYEEVDCDRRRQ